MQDRGISYPGGDFNYSDGRFTNSSDTKPGSNAFVGVWHEQLARNVLSLPASTPSLDGGDDFAFGGATTEDGTQDYTLLDASFFGSVTVTIDNMGKQVDDYVTRRMLDPNALFVVWGGGNDLFNDDTSTNVTATASRMAMLVSKLAQAGARYFLVPNVPPLGGVPRYSDNGTAQAAKNRASADYRAQLDANLDATVSSLNAQGIQIQLRRLDIWSLFVRFVSDPTRYGFVDFLHSAQGASGINVDKYLFWDDIHPTTAAHGQIALEADRVLTGSAVLPGRAVNLSTRVNVSSGDNIGVGGFIIAGSEPKRVVLRGIGPSLEGKGVQGSLPNPFIELFDSTGTSVYSNEDWKDTQAVEIAATGLAPTNDRESAMIQTLAPGSYTVRLTGGPNATAGVGLVEVYDVDSAAKSNLANLSTRGFVGSDDNSALIGGVIVDSGGDPIIVVRAIGPSLAKQGIALPLLDPTLELFNSNGTQIGLNDDWRQGQPTATKATQLSPGDDRESVIVASLPPSNYTAVVRGKNGATGTALVEVYRIQ